MLRKFIPLIITLGLFVISPATATATTTCADGWYPVDAQSWWWQPSFGPDKDLNARHLHVGGCIPRRTTTLTGTVPFDITVKMHNNPGKVYYVAIVVKTDSMEKSISVNPAWACPTADCTFVKRFDLPVSTFDKSGLEEIRFRASDRQADLGTEIRASVNFQTQIANGKTFDNVGRYPFLRGKGWYSSALYCEAGLRDDLVPVPSAPVGAWSPSVRHVNHGSSDAPLTHSEERLDPNIHAGIAGSFLRDAPGQFSGAVSVPALPTGEHKLFLKSDCDTPSGRNSGIVVVPFSSL